MKIYVRQYQESAENGVRYSLVLRELMEAENVEVQVSQIEAQLDQMLTQFGEQAPAFRQFFDTPQMRDNISNDLLYQEIMDRLMLIGQGERPRRGQNRYC